MKNKQPLLAAGLLLGIGLGGFVDGILFHQILQVHGMLSNVFYPDTISNIEINMFWDGLFHAFTWISTVVGVFLLWQGLTQKERHYSGRQFFGLLLIGWGLFNSIEGILDHLILKLHHVMQRTSETMQLYSDLAFLASGLLLCWIGYLLVRQNNSYRSL